MKSDFELKEDVLAELAWDPLVPHTLIGVAVKDGLVTLSGHLDTYAQKVAAQRAVERVSHVKAIAMEIDVIPSGQHQRSDTEIAAAVQHSLSWHSSLPQGRITVLVEKGVVTLGGELDWNFQRRAVERMIRSLNGVVGIVDNIRLKAQPVPDKIADRIAQALTRQAVREARHIQVDITGSTVTLRGHVHSRAEKDAVEGTTWSAPGVSHVNSQLTIG
jgi:osmotically-inducible protein OsmY